MSSRPIQNNTQIKEGKSMKPIAIFSLFAAMLFASCSVTKPGAIVYDDVYYSPSDPVVHVKEVVITHEKLIQNQQQYYKEEDVSLGYEPAYPETEYYIDPEGSIVNHYNIYGDFYDYSYTSRIRRFHRPYGLGSYFHDYYTNMYWYNFNPHYWGSGFHIGYGFYPTAFHFGWGWPSRSFWYNPFFMSGMGYPHFYHGWYSSYWHGYRHGFGGGFWGFPFYGRWWHHGGDDEDSYYYGPRIGFAGNTKSGGSGDSGRPAAFGGRYKKDPDAETLSREADRGSRGSRPDSGGEFARGSRPGTADGSRIVTDTQRGETHTSTQEARRTGSREPAVSREGQRPDIAPAKGRETYERPKNNPRPEPSVAPNQRTYQYGRENIRQAPAYERPSVHRERAQRKPQPYSSPRYTKPTTSEEFTSPAYRKPWEATRSAKSTTPQRQNIAPAPQRQAAPQASPDRQQSRQPRYTPPPSRPSNNRQSPPPSRYSPPSRSTTQPSRSTPSYTSPRRSSPPASRSSAPRYSAPPSRSSSTAPSRSSGPSVSSPSRSSGSSAPSRGSSSSSSRSSGRRNR